MAKSHHWTLDGIELFELIAEDGLDLDSEQSILDPSEVELGETIHGVMECVDRIRPARIVFDSLSELRLLSQNSLRYRRQILALKHYFSTRACTVIMLDDRSSDPGDIQLHSIAHGVIVLEQSAQDYGSERRRLRVVKMRGVKYRGGYHDFVIETGGVAVFPRLIANEHHTDFLGELVLDGLARARHDDRRRAAARDQHPAQRSVGRGQDDDRDPLWPDGDRARREGGLFPVRRRRRHLHGPRRGDGHGPQAALRSGQLACRKSTRPN